VSSASLGSEVCSVALADLGAMGLCQDVQLRDRQTQNVVNPVLQVRRFALGPKAQWWRMWIS
jgi:hypothetical protein